MLIVESGPFGRRFRLLETMRQFGAEHLSETGTTDVIAARHAQWCLDEVTHIRELLAGPAEIEGVARLDELWPNLRAAVDWACATDDRQLAPRTRRSGRGRGLPAESERDRRLGRADPRHHATRRRGADRLRAHLGRPSVHAEPRQRGVRAPRRSIRRAGSSDDPLRASVPLRRLRGDGGIGRPVDDRAAPARRALHRGPQRARRGGADAADDRAVGGTRCPRHRARRAVSRARPADVPAMGTDVPRHLCVGAGQAPRGRAVLRGRGRRRRSRPHAHVEESPRSTSRAPPW